MAVASVPITPPAPLRFSTTKGWPSVDWRRSAITRAMMSVVPPGGKGTSIFTCLVGQAWPKAESEMQAAASAAAQRVKLFMVSPPVFF